MVDLRKEFIAAAAETTNISQLCREFEISRTTAYKWLNRYEQGDSLEDRSKAPKTIANKTPEEVESLVLQLRSENPGWGGKTIHKVLENQGIQNLPSAKTVCNILKRNNCIEPSESQKRQAFVRFQREHCNELWQADFKGEFKLGNGQYCYPLDIIDDCSRFALKIVSAEGKGNVVIPAFESTFREYGLPQAILSDNGAQFAGFKNGYTQFEKWLMNLDVLPIHGRPYHPQTQGKIERFHRSMKSELLSHNSFMTIEDADTALQQWKDKYNSIRPHEALHMLCPADVYVKSNRVYSDKPKPYEYGGQYHVIKVNNWGYVRFDRWQMYLSETMIDEHVEFRPNPLGDSFLVCYRNFQIAEFDAVTGKRLNRNISRL